MADCDIKTSPHADVVAKLASDPTLVTDFLASSLRFLQCRCMQQYLDLLKDVLDNDESRRISYQQNLIS